MVQLRMNYILPRRHQPGQQKLQQLLFVTPGETALGQANVMDFYCKLFL